MAPYTLPARMGMRPFERLRRGRYTKGRAVIPHGPNKKAVDGVCCGPPTASDRLLFGIVSSPRADRRKIKKAAKIKAKIAGKVEHLKTILT
jgi:hypothetical protein